MTQQDINANVMQLATLFPRLMVLDNVNASKLITMTGGLPLEQLVFAELLILITEKLLQAVALVNVLPTWFLVLIQMEFANLEMLSMSIVQLMTKLFVSQVTSGAEQEQKTVTNALRHLLLITELSKDLMELKHANAMKLTVGLMFQELVSITNVTRLDNKAQKNVGCLQLELQ